MMIVWDVESGKALYGSPNREIIHQIKFFNKNENKLIAIQDKGVQILTVDKENKKVVIFLIGIMHHRLIKKILFFLDFLH